MKSMNILCNHFLPCVVGKKRWKMQIRAGKKVNDVATVSDEAFVLLVLENIWEQMIDMDINKYYRPKKRKAINDDRNNNEGNNNKGNNDERNNNERNNDERNNDERNNDERNNDDGNDDDGNDDDGNDDDRNDDATNAKSSTAMNWKRKDCNRVFVTGRWTSAWRGSRRYGGWSPEGLHRFNKLVKMVQQDRLTDTHFQPQYEIWLKEMMSDKSKQKVCTRNHQPIVRAYRDLTLLGV